MNKQLVIHEKYSRFWPAIAMISLLLSIILFIGYLYSNNVLLEGYLQLSAYGFFALGILSLFKVREGQIQMTFKRLDHTLIIVYRIRDEIIQEHEINMKDINDLSISPMPNKSLYNDLVRSDKCVTYKSKKVGGWVYLTEWNGKIIPLSPENARSVVSFIEA